MCAWMFELYKWPGTLDVQERWTIWNVHTEQDELSETFAKSRLRFKKQRNHCSIWVKAFQKWPMTWSNDGSIGLSESKYKTNKNWFYFEHFQSKSLLFLFWFSQNQIQLYFTFLNKNKFSFWFWQPYGFSCCRE